MDRSERDRRSYRLAMEFMLNLDVPGVTESLLNTYLHPDTEAQTTNDIHQLYERLLSTAQNPNMWPIVIGKAIGGFRNFGQVVFNFDPERTLEQYTSWEQILDQVEEQLQPRGKIRRTSRSIWPKYCMTALSAAEFITKFDSGQDFHEWVRVFDQDARARPALPMLLEREIYGYGFPLACDFLKELGYHNFAKPDVHIKDIFEILTLARNRKDYEVFCAVVRIAQAVDDSPYCVDKLFWLIGSGYFYDHPEIGNNGRIGNHKAKFCDYASRKLNEAP